MWNDKLTEATGHEKQTETSRIMFAQHPTKTDNIYATG